MKLDPIKSITSRTLGLLMMSIIPGAGVGAVFAKDWYIGGLIAFGTAVAIVISYLGVALAWNGKFTNNDIQEAFRTATAKAGDTNNEIKDTIKDMTDPKSNG